MFEGEKTYLFWIGLIILALASVTLFQQLFTVVGYYAIYNSDYYLRSSVPQIVGGIVFILIGFYMMKSGAKEKHQG